VIKCLAMGIIQYKESFMRALGSAFLPAFALCVLVGAGIAFAEPGQPRLEYMGMHDYPKFSRIVFETKGLPPKSFNIRYDELRGKVIVYAPGGLDYSFNPVRSASRLIIDVDYTQLPDSSIGVMLNLTRDALGFRVSYLERPDRLVIDIYRSSEFEPIMPISRKVDTIVIDPGHGGARLGVNLGDGLIEKDAMVDVALRLAGRLGRMGYQTELTRSGDAEEDFETRAGLANSSGGGIYISLHASAGLGVRAAKRGVYVMGEGPLAATGMTTQPYGWGGQHAPYLPDSLRLAKELTGGLSGLGGGTVMTRDLPLAGFCGLAMPGAMVEVGTMDELADEGFRDMAAESLAKAINSYASGVAH
jgi:N-acetylmuramoyl-L-alanine amidase